MNISVVHDFWIDLYSGEIPLTGANHLAWCERGELEITDIPTDYFDRWIDDYKKNRKVTNWRKEMGE